MKFEVIVTATATIEERWLVEADSDDDAREKFENRDADWPEGMELIGDRVVGDEENREVDDVIEYVPDAPAKTPLPWTRIVVIAILGALVVLVARDLLSTVFAWIGLGGLC